MCKGQNAGARPAPDFSKLRKMQREKSALFFPFYHLLFLYSVVFFFFSPCDASLTMRFVTLRRPTFYINNCAFVGVVTEKVTAIFLFQEITEPVVLIAFTS